MDAGSFSRVTEEAKTLPPIAAELLQGSEATRCASAEIAAPS